MLRLRENVVESRNDVVAETASATHRDRAESAFRVCPLEHSRDEWSRHQVKPSMMPSESSCAVFARSIRTQARYALAGILVCVLPAYSDDGFPSDWSAPLPAPVYSAPNLPPLNPPLNGGDVIYEEHEIVVPVIPHQSTPAPVFSSPSLFAPAFPDSGATNYQNYQSFKISPGSGLRTEDAAAVRLAISADLLRKVFSRTTSQCGDVNDCILGARVTGQQQTQTSTELVLVPNTAAAAFEVVLSGVTNANTFGATEIAGIVSSTNSRFEMRKPFSFDGQQFRTSTPGATVWPDQHNHAAVPLRGNVPILRRVIGAIAYNEAERRRPASQRITAYRVTEDASGQFNTRVDEALGKLQGEWTGKVIPLVKEHLPSIDYPLARSTADHAIFALPSPWATADRDPLDESWVERGGAVSFAVHESALKAGIERLALGGFDVGPGDYDRAIRQFAPGVVDGPIPKFDAQTGSLVLDTDDPAHVEFRDGQFRVILNAKIKTPIGELPTQKITMPWTFAADSEWFYSDPGEPTVEPATTESSPMMGLVRPIIVAQLKKELLPLKMPRTITLPTQGSEAEIKLHLKDLKCRDGWLVIGWDAPSE